MPAILQTCTPRCKATVELVSKVIRPYMFDVTVIGEPPHACRRVYRVVAPGDYENAADSAAMKGMELFIKEFSRSEVVTNTGTVVPRVRLV